MINETNLSPPARAPVKTESPPQRSLSKFEKQEYPQQTPRSAVASTRTSAKRSSVCFCTRTSTVFFNIEGTGGAKKHSSVNRYTFSCGTKITSLTLSFKFCSNLLAILSLPSFSRAKNHLDCFFPNLRPWRMFDGPHSLLCDQLYHLDCLFQKLRHWCSSTVRCCTRSCGMSFSSSCTTTTISSMTERTRISPNEPFRSTSTPSSPEKPASPSWGTCTSTKNSAVRSSHSLLLHNPQKRDFHFLSTNPLRNLLLRRNFELLNHLPPCPHRSFPTSEKLAHS